MFENISYRNKLIGLAVIAVLLFLTANKRSFRVTVNAYRQMKTTEKELSEMQRKNMEMQSLVKETDIYSGIPVHADKGKEEVQQEILRFATRFAAIRIDKLEETHSLETDDYIVYTNRLTVKGGFYPLLKMTYAFEKDFRYSDLIGIKFGKQRNFRTRTDELKEYLIFQNYEKK